MEQEKINNLTKAFHQALRDSGLDRMFRSPSYRYVTRSDSKDRYFWTTQKVRHKNGSKYVAGIYRDLKTKNQMKLVKRVGFAKRYKAKSAAIAMRDKGL